MRGIEYKKFDTILDNVKRFSKSQTPEASIRRTVNELYKKGQLKKAYEIDGVFYDWKKQLDSTRIPRYYKLDEYFTRKIISTMMYAGGGGKKEKWDLKAWTFDRMENKDVNRKAWLCEKLLEKLKESKVNGWFPDKDSNDGGYELNPKDSGVSWEITKEQLEKAIDSHSVNKYGYDDNQTQEKPPNTDEIYKNFKVTIRGVEQ